MAFRVEPCRKLRLLFFSCTIFIFPKMNNYFFHLFSCLCIYHKICLNIFSQLCLFSEYLDTADNSIHFTFLKTHPLEPLTRSSPGVYPLSLLPIWQPGISSLILLGIFFPSLLCWVFSLPYSMSFSFLIYSLFLEGTTFQMLSETRGGIYLETWHI